MSGSAVFTPDLETHTSIYSLAGAVIVKVAYGIEVKLQDDPHIVAAEKALLSLAAVGTAVSYLGALRTILW